MEPRAWSPDDIDYLTENYGTTHVTDIADYLDRSVKSVRRKADALHLTNRTRWTWKDTQQLHRLAGTKSVPEIARLTGRTASAVRNKMEREGISRDMRKPKNVPWSNDDLRVVDGITGVGSAHEVAEVLGRDLNSVKSMMKRRGASVCRAPWTEDEIRFVFDNYGDLPKQTMSSILNRPENDIDAIAAYHNEKDDRP